MGSLPSPSLRKRCWQQACKPKRPRLTILGSPRSWSISPPWRMKHNIQGRFAHDFCCQLPDPHKRRSSRPFARRAARRQVAVERLLIDLVHMEKGIGGAIVEGGVLDVLTDDARAFLVAAAEEIGAGVMVEVGVFVPLPWFSDMRRPLRKRPRAFVANSRAAAASMDCYPRSLAVKPHGNATLPCSTAGWRPYCGPGPSCGSASPRSWSMSGRHAASCNRRA